MVRKRDKLGVARAGMTGAILLVLVVCFAGIPALSGVAVAAETEATTYTLQVMVGPYGWEGTTSPPPGTYEYVAGTTAILTAVETDIWDFLYWSVVHYDATWDHYKKATVKILMDEDHLACAYFGYKGGGGGPDPKP